MAYIRYIEDKPLPSLEIACAQFGHELLCGVVVGADDDERLERVDCTSGAGRQCGDERYQRAKMALRGPFYLHCTYLYEYSISVPSSHTLVCRNRLGNIQQTRSAVARRP